MFEIIDFHTHPFWDGAQNICAHKDHIPAMDKDGFRAYMEGLGIKTVCGSVVSTEPVSDAQSMWEKISRHNEAAYRLKEHYGDFYIPGIHVHPAFVKESCEEIEKAARRGVRLIGELVPYLDGWKAYDDPDFWEILDMAEQYDMVVSFHSANDFRQMDAVVASHPNLIFVGAHPGEATSFLSHLERLKNNENYYLDVSGTGLFRHGMLKRAVDTVGAERVLFGSDFPTCSPAVFIGGVLFESLITDSEKEKIFSLNARRLLGL